MKIVVGCVLLVVLSGCIPIGFQARTLANAGPALEAGTPTTACEANADRVSA